MLFLNNYIGSGPDLKTGEDSGKKQSADEHKKPRRGFFLIPIRIARWTRCDVVPLKRSFHIFSYVK